MEKFTIRTTRREVLVDITSEVQSLMRKSGIKDGICVVFVPHTTAGVTINENADPSVKLDISEILAGLVPAGRQYRHLEGNADSHVKATLVGSSVTIIIRGGALVLGTWQGIQFCEFDGPRTRQVYVNFLSAS